MNPYEPPKGDIEPPKRPKSKRDYTMTAAAVGMTGWAVYQAIEGDLMGAGIIGIVSAMLWKRATDRKG
jgi:hypothetical protein